MAMKNSSSYPFPIVTLVLENPELLVQQLELFQAERFIPRLWEQDWTLWKPEPKAISDRLGWLQAPEKMKPLCPEIKSFAAEVKKTGFRYTLLLGMGGSSLAPEVLSQLLAPASGFPGLYVLDTTVPATIRKKADLCPPAKTLYLVSSKSGTTAETAALFRYFFSRATAELGPDLAAHHFVAITDPGTPLDSIASALRFRKIWLADPTIGGRFSAFSPFGLVPAAIQGIEIYDLLHSASQMMSLCQKENPSENPGALLTAFLATAAAQGRDKFLLWVEPEIESFADWLEQLIAESTGKEGQGLLLVVGREELLALTELRDVAFIWIGTPNASFDFLQAEVRRQKIPAIFLSFRPQQEIGAMFFLWEWATALVGSCLKINPFDQPDVERTKLMTQAILKDWQTKQAYPGLEGGLVWRNFKLYSSRPAASFEQALRDFLSSAQRASYLSLQAFLPPEAETKLALEGLRRQLIYLLGRPVTLGWGPRYLHSTGQLHKGDSGHGFFWQLTADDEVDMVIPETPGGREGWLTFSRLKEAQVRGDYEALRSLGRRLIRVHLGKDIARGIEELREKIGDLPTAEK